MNGVIVVCKPQEFTSFDVVAVMRRLCGQRKIGHTGTLDPMATGVLPVLLGAAAKAQDILPDSDKEYEAQFRLGITTDTLDIWGEIKSEKPSALNRQDVQSLLPRFTGKISQLPPMYSAVKKDGVRLYELARQGVTVERKPREVTVSRLELRSFDDVSQTGTLSIACSKGTYIRSLIDDLGAVLGCGAVMTSLVRTRACGFDLNDAFTIERLRELTENGERPEMAEKVLRSTESLFEKYPRLTVSDKQALRFSNGNQLDIDKTALRSKTTDGEIIRVCSRKGEFIALGKVDSESGVIKVYKMLR